MTYKYWNSGNNVAIFRIPDVAEHDILLQDFSIKSLKARATPLT